MSLGEIIYASTVRALKAVSPLLAWGSSKVARGIRGRRDAVGTLSRWGAAARREGDLVWFHAASVGEALQARAVMEVMRSRRSNLQIAFTHFSPSAEALAGRMPADVAGYLPWDVSGDVGAALDALRPSALVFTHKEIWPSLTLEASRRGVSVALVAATLPQGAGRLNRLARPVLGPALGRLALVAAIAPDDAERFVRLGARPDAVQVTGDPAVDSAWASAHEPDRTASHMAPFGDCVRPTVVAGSTWEPDETVLLDALDLVRATHADLCLVLAPHEPTDETVARLRSALSNAGWSVATLGEVEALGEVSDVDAVVVDRVGVLAHLYSVGSVAYVGGGFHRHGLHNVLEPAAAGRPTLIGPRHGNSRAAADLLGEGGVVVARDARALAQSLSAWLGDDDARAEAGKAASDYIDEHRGAAERTAELLETYLPED